MLGRSEDRRVSASSDFNFSDSAGMKECGHSDANTSLKGRRVSWENDLGDVSCDSEGPEASEVPLTPAPPRSSSKRSRAAEVHNQSEKVGFFFFSNLVILADYVTHGILILG